MMERWKGRVALVTGASVGIGAAIAKDLVRHGMKVMGCARDVSKVQVCNNFKLNFFPLGCMKLEKQLKCNKSPNLFDTNKEVTTSESRLTVRK